MLLRLEALGRFLHIELGATAPEAAEDALVAPENVPTPMVETPGEPADPIGFRLWQYPEEEP